MKINQMMTVDLGGHLLNIDKHTQMGNLTQLWSIGNSIRVANGLSIKRLDDYFTRPETEGLVTAIERILGIEFDRPQIKVNNGTCPTVKSPLIIAKRGRYGGTWAHEAILFDAAGYLHPSLKAKLLLGITNTNVRDLIESMDVQDLPPDLFVYVAKETVSGRYKVGISRNPIERVKNLNVGNPDQIELVTIYKATEPGFESERQAHRKLEPWQIRGEWFSADAPINLLGDNHVV